MFCRFLRPSARISPLFRPFFRPFRRIGSPGSPSSPPIPHPAPPELPPSRGFSHPVALKTPFPWGFPHPAASESTLSRGFPQGAATKRIDFSRFPQTYSQEKAASRAFRAALSPQTGIWRAAKRRRDSDMFAGANAIYGCAARYICFQQMRYIASGDVMRSKFLHSRPEGTYRAAGISRSFGAYRKFRQEFISPRANGALNSGLAPVMLRGIWRCNSRGDGL